MPGLTKKTKKEHVEGAGGSCPYCKSFHIQGDSYDFAAPILRQKVSCIDCGEVWYDVYKLVDVKEG